MKDEGGRMKTILLLIVLMAIGAATAAAQSGTELRGRVTDERDANIAGAEVRLRMRAGGELLTTTNDHGAYEFSNVAPGDYVLEVRAKGFAIFTSPELNVERGRPITENVQLQIEAVSESVVVTASGTTQRADEVSKAVTVVDQQEIDERNESAIAESLRTVPGLRVQQLGGPGS